MYIKELEISSKKKILRTLTFHCGVNLIVDNTPIEFKTETGNNVGKTTVLKLIDYCLGGTAEKLLKDAETKNELSDLKKFLIDNEVIIKLVLVNDFKSKDKKVIIRRNFLLRNKRLMEINGQNFSKNKGKDFINHLDEILIGDREQTKPTFRQLVAHNIRYSDNRISNTLKMVDTYTTAADYETLHLYMFGLQAPDRGPLLGKLQNENNFRKRLMKEKDKTELELQLNLIEQNIKELEKTKDHLVVNKHYEEDVEQMMVYKAQLNKLSSEISELKLRKDLLLETKEELESDYSNVSVELLKKIYEQATTYNVEPLNKKFNELVQYHNEMILEKIHYVTEDIPALEKQISNLEQQFSDINADKNLLEEKISQLGTFQDLEDIITQMNEEYRKKGEVMELISQINNTEKNIKDINHELEESSNIFSDAFQNDLKERLNIFNLYFSKVSKELYNEEYGVTYEIKKDRKSSKNIYHFKCFNNNISAGKKQGEIICFDLAYILFARDYNIPHVDFLLNDKKELMHGTQLIEVANFAKENSIQLIFSILKDKLPQQLNHPDNIVVELAQDDKLFRMEQLQ